MNELKKCNHKELLEKDGVDSDGYLAIEIEHYLNPCKYAGCSDGIHQNCGQQHRWICLRCDEVIYDSAASEDVEGEGQQVDGGK